MDTLSLDQAIALHRQGRLREALSGYEAILRREPRNADAMGLKALVVESLGDPAQAEALLAASLDADGAPEIQLRNLNNLLVMLLEAGRTEDASRLIDRPLPAWPAERVPTPVETRTLASLFGALLKFERRTEALAFGRSVVRRLLDDINLVAAVVDLMIKAGDVREAAEVVGLLKDRPGDEGTLVITLRGAIAELTGGKDASRSHADAFAARMPVHHAPRVPSQTLCFAVLNWRPQVISAADTLRDLHFVGNFPEQLASRHADRYRVHSVLVDAPGIEAKLPIADVTIAINNCANAERLALGGEAERVSRIGGLLGVPIVNDPLRAVGASRLGNAKHLAGLEGVVVPRVLAIEPGAASREQQAEEIIDTLGLPVIIRIAWTHMGAATWLIRSEAELVATLTEKGTVPLYAIEFAAAPHRDGLYRQLRVGVVGDRITLIRANFGSAWNVRARNNKVAIAFHAENPHLIGVANSLVENPDGILTATIRERLAAIVERVPLDIFGIDFDIDDDGRIVFSEANATMNLLSTSTGELRYPIGAENAFLADVDAYLRRRVFRH